MNGLNQVWENSFDKMTMDDAVDDPGDQYQNVLLDE